MDKLLSPDFGLMFWTIVNFLLLAVILGAFAWKPMLKMLEEREKKIADDKAQAESARLSAEKIKAELEEKLKNISSEAEAKMRSALALAGTQRDQILTEAKENAAGILKTATAQLEAEKQKAVREAQKEIVNLTLLVSGKFIAQTNNKEADEKRVNALLKDIEKGNS